MTITTTELPVIAGGAVVGIADVLAAREAYEGHFAEHHCRIGECPERRALWLAYQATAGRWGLPPEGRRAA